MLCRHTFVQCLWWVRHQLAFLPSTYYLCACTKSRPCNSVVVVGSCPSYVFRRLYFYTFNRLFPYWMVLYFQCRCYLKPSIWYFDSVEGCMVVYNCLHTFHVKFNLMDINMSHRQSYHVSLFLDDFSRYNCNRTLIKLLSIDILYTAHLYIFLEIIQTCDIFCQHMHISNIF